MARKILLADDSVTAQNMGRKILADAGYEVITVNNGSAALKKIPEIKPDLIVLDVYMPGYSGLEVCQRLKETQETSRIPILLTVGKLEPFKPEEAKRARADSFIVKPFEASELLSALAKLEEKIVPKAEASKPGRFARAIAAVEEGRYDRSMTVEEDSGWKDRIAFPTGKKKKAPEEDSVDDPAIYNPVNRDLRTVVERHRAPAAREAHSEAVHLDLAALVPEGLPKDVTPEEIAALAAAAAQVKGILEGKTAEPAHAPEAKTQEPQIEAAKAEVAKIEVAKTEEEVPAAKAAHSAVEATPLPEVSGVAAPPASEAEKSVEAPPDAPPPSPSYAELAAAIAALEPEPAAPASSGNGLESHITGNPVDEPVTMAVATRSESAVGASRWTAVSVALAPEEAGISLELEMQKAQADAAAAESAHAELVAAFAKAQIATVEPEPVPVTPSPAETIAQEVAASEPVIPAVVPEPEPAQPPSETSFVSDAIRVAVTDYETVEVSRTDEALTVDAAPRSALAQPFEMVAVPVAEAQQAEVPEPEAASVISSVESAAPAPEFVISSVTERAQEEQIYEAQQHEELPKATEESKPGEVRTEEPLPIMSVTPPADPEITTSAREITDAPIAQPEAEVPAPENSQIPESANPLPSEPAEMPAAVEASGTEVVAKKESEIAATTAAAWASWRKIRESGDSGVQPAPGPAPHSEEAPGPRDEAAMAVAAGAEKAPDDVSPATESESPDIANIVDSVLADLRPKIVAEISRKLGKKK